MTDYKTISITNVTYEYLQRARGKMIRQFATNKTFSETILFLALGYLEEVEHDH